MNANYFFFFVFSLLVVLTLSVKGIVLWQNVRDVWEIIISPRCSIKTQNSFLLVLFLECVCSALFCVSFYYFVHSCLFLLLCSVV